MLLLFLLNCFSFVSAFSHFSNHSLLESPPCNSVIEFFILVWFFIFSNSLLKTNFSLCSSSLLPSSLVITFITLNSLSSRLPISTSLSSSGVLFFPSSGTCSSVASFCLICCFYFYVSGRLVTFPDWEKWPFVGNILWGPAAHSPLDTRAICSRAVPIGRHWSFCCGRLPIVRGLIGVAGPWSFWLPGPAFCWGCWLIDGRGSGPGTSGLCGPPSSAGGHDEAVDVCSDPVSHTSRNAWIFPFIPEQ